jgi:TatD DNase family protein
MYIDIHRHSANKGNADIVLRNLFHSETDQIELTQYCSVGLHPWHVSEKKIKKHMRLLTEASGHKNCIAIGEAGLDKAIDIPVETQRIAFEQQIELAGILQKPMIIHCVRAYDELQSYRKKSNHKKSWIVHWYNASPQTGADLIKKGCYLSFGHMLFNESSKAFKTFLEIPLSKIFLETDDASVTIHEVYERAASLKEISIDELKGQMVSNFYNCFDIKL